MEADTSAYICNIIGTIVEISAKPVAALQQFGSGKGQNRAFSTESGGQLTCSRGSPVWQRQNERGPPGRIAGGSAGSAELLAATPADKAIVY
jgi:hypothetical protein